MAQAALDSDLIFDPERGQWVNTRMSAPLSAEKPQLKIGLLDFEPVRVAGFESLCEPLTHVTIVHTTLREALADSNLDMIMLGLQSPAQSFDLLGRVKAARPRLKMIVMGRETDEETIISAIAAGAKGYLEETASPEQVIMCIDVVASGSIWAPRKVLSTFVDRLLNPSENKRVRRHNPTFTKREEEVLKLLQAARSNREIARTMGIEERTVKSHIANLIRKAGVANRIALSVRAATWDRD
ncbi:MAG TPA: response regulator transcription factor [Silvibacterium sp.]|nr:response regulator transcription factor [Silvibacterium sp.]